MAMLSEISLGSPNANLLARFLAEMLELEWDQEEQEEQDQDSYESIRLLGPHFTLAIIEREMKERNPTPSMTIEFKVEAEEELHSLWQRYVFVMYRLRGERLGAKAPLMRQKMGSKEKLTLMIKDPDGRLWPFVTTSTLQ